MFRIILVLFAALAPLRAEWTFSAATPLSAPAGIEFVRRTAGNHVELHIVTFQSKMHTFAVMDNPEGAFDLASAAAKRGALAAVNADTWSTELGVLSSGRPRLITSLKPVEKGTSGGVSLVGTLAALAGAALGLVGTMAALGSFEFGIFGAMGGAGVSAIVALARVERAERLGA